MKNLILAVALFYSISPLHAFAGDPDFCNKATDIAKKWVVETRQKLRGHTGSIERVQLDIASGQQFNGVANRMSARANLLLDKDLTPNEVRVDLYALCMSIT